MFDGVIESQKRFLPRVFNRFSFKVYIQQQFPRFGITDSQKQYNYFRQIKWEDYQPFIIELDDSAIFEIAEDL